MALDTSNNWVAGDDLLVIEALKLPFGQYTLDCVQRCMNQLEVIDVSSSLKVKGLLTDYATARSAQEAANLADVEGKTLIRADVLEWSKNEASADGLQNEIMLIQRDLANWFAFCECMDMGAFSGYGMQSSLIRS